MPGATHPRPVRIYLWYPAEDAERAEPMRFGRYASLASDDVWPPEIAGNAREKLAYSRRPLARSLDGRQLSTRCSGGRSAPWSRPSRWTGRFR
ncbi:MAG TPA: hypothetical protein VIN61_07295 [Gammaproteobacteria bacterium]